MGKQIEIKGETYDILSSLEEVDRVDSKTGKFIGEHTLIELYKVGSKMLSATHILKIYENPKKNLFFYARL